MLKELATKKSRGESEQVIRRIDRVRGEMVGMERMVQEELRHAVRS